MSVIGSNIIAGASGTVETGYQIARSLRFNSPDTAYLSRTPASAGNRQIYTWSGWIKRSAIAAGTYYGLFTAGLGTGGNNGIFFDTGSGGLYFTATDGITDILVSSSIYRDPSAWYHVLVAVDTTQATASNRVKMYVNGVQLTTFSSATYPAQNSNATYINTANQHRIGSHTNAGYYFDGYIADVRFIDGQALTPSSFGQTDSATGVWVPITYAGTYGTNGFWLKFDDNSAATATALGKDSSGNGNNWTPSATFSVTAGRGNDSLVDSPTNYGTDTGVGGEVRGNYATLNPLNNPGGTFSNGNLDWTSPSTDQRIALSSIAIDGSSKWYAEVTAVSKSGTYYAVGVFGNPQTWNPRLLYRSDGARWIDSTAQSPNWASYTDNDVIGIAYDGTTGVATFYKNGVSQGSMTVTSTTTTQYFGCASDGTGGSTSMNYSWNFGQRPFAYTAPSGFKALCTTNLPTPAIGASAGTLASKNFNAVLYTGDGNATQNITGVGFQPDLQWIKMRGGTAWHMVSDAVRGVNINIFPNDTGAEITNNANGYTSAFSSDGFTVAKGSTSADNTNKASTTYVGWSWKANGAGSSNTAGTLSSTVSVNTSAGISIVAFAVPSGTSNYTVGHGLGVAPAMIITKGRGSADNWVTFHKSVCTNVDTLLRLNTTGAAGTLTNVWGSSLPDSSVFGIKVGTTLLASQNAIAYCFAEVEGFSKFGKYTGNANADGPFVYCGFRPRFIMVKRTDAIDSWMIYDTVRNSYNIANLALYPNASTTETTETNNPFDILSNGFKVRGSGTTTNASSGTYIFAAFAEAPFNYARAR